MIDENEIRPTAESMKSLDPENGNPQDFSSYISNDQRVQNSVSKPNFDSLAPGEATIKGQEEIKVTAPNPNQSSNWDPKRVFDALVIESKEKDRKIEKLATELSEIKGKLDQLSKAQLESSRKEESGGGFCCCRRREREKDYHHTPVSVPAANTLEITVLKSKV